MCIALLAASGAFAWDMIWQNQVPGQFTDSAGDGIIEGMVQLIVDGGDGVITDPMAEILAMAPGTRQAALEAWIAGGCMPMGDDYLHGDADNPTLFGPDTGYPEYNGFFVVVYISGNEPDGTKLYTRFFEEEAPTEGSWYGTVGDIDGIGDFFEVVQYGGGSYAEDYIFDPEVGPQVDTRMIIPEPATVLVGGIALLLGLIRRKK